MSDIEKSGRFGIDAHGRVTRAVMAMREAMTNDRALRDRLSGADEQDIAGALEDRFWGSYPDGEVREAAAAAAAAVMSMRRDPGAYVIDTASGNALFRATDDMILHPEDTVGEDGLLRKQLPVLHPRLSSALALSAQERQLERKIEESVPDGMARSTAHKRDPWKISEEAASFLSSRGIREVDTAEHTHETTVEIGHEHVNEMKQAPNFRFNRTAAFGASLAKRIADMGVRTFHIISIDRKKDSRRTWFEVKVRH